ncbi:hypothetical protein KAR48_16760 [bacterium]|nr:hypothetical protein [bacterium]
MKHGMSVIVQSIARLMVPFIWMFGIYIIAHGHISPGGGFAGGVFLAGGFILITLAFGSAPDKEERSQDFASKLESEALLIFLIMASIGLVLKLGLMANLLAKTHPGLPGHIAAGGLIPWENLAIGVEVSAALAVMFIAFARHRLKE